MDREYVVRTLNQVSTRLKGQNVTNLLNSIASKAENLQKISRDDQLLLGAMLGSMLHKAYCDSRRLPTPNEKGLKNNPRVKKLSDELDKEFIENVLSGKVPQSDTLYVENGKVMLDIANTEFVDLSPYWKHDNFMAGCAASRSIITSWKGLSSKNPEVREMVTVAVANGIHEAWIARGNVYESFDGNNVYTNKDLETAYVNLPVDEQDKDLEHMKMAMTLVGELQQKMSQTQE